jgi:5-methylthioribose kinase
MNGPETGDLVDALRRLGLVRDGETAQLTPLTGGVSSDIHLVEAGGRKFCVKRALPRLKVAAVWEAPIGRNAAEATWFRTVRPWLPDNVPEVLAEDPDIGLFAMTYLPPAQNPVWKAKLLAGEIHAGFAASVGEALCTIHRRSAGDRHLAEAFANDDTFEAIRLEPYLRATAVRHPDLAERLNALADTTMATRRALVHGDISPKNILCGPKGPVFLDAECAWFGDPAFDLAFCLNHLLLKGAWRPDLRAEYVKAFRALAAAYFGRIDWEEPQIFESRCARLLPGLFLARVDGKSPVEYLDEASREMVRAAARALLLEPVERLENIADFWERSR